MNTKFRAILNTKRKRIFKSIPRQGCEILLAWRVLCFTKECFITQKRYRSRFFPNPHQTTSPFLLFVRYFNGGKSLSRSKLHEQIKRPIKNVFETRNFHKQTRRTISYISIIEYFIRSMKIPSHT